MVLAPPPSVPAAPAALPAVSSISIVQPKPANYPHLVFPDAADRLVIRCVIPAIGGIKGCRRVDGPKSASLGVLPATSVKFAASPMIVDGKAVAGGELTISASPTSANCCGDGFWILAWAPWIRTPSAEDVAAAFSKRGSAASGYGLVAMTCAFRPDGGLTGCTLTPSTSRTDLNAAALSLAPSFRIDTTRSKTREPDIFRLSTKVVITVDFSARALQPPSERYLRAPDWVRTVDDVAMTDAYPAAAKAGGVLSGLATVDCRVASTGMLEACVPVSETPADVGFAQAALRVAPLMQANLWTRDGEAAAGQKVRLPLHFIATAGSNPSPAAGSGR